MSFTYAIPDLHGRADLLDEALVKIQAHAVGRRAFVVTLGDYVDRGPNSCQVIERLMAWPYSDLHLVALKGNHEAMMWEACSGLDEPDIWLRNGGVETLASYGLDRHVSDLRSVLPETHLAWIGQLPSLYADKHRIFVHAGVDNGIPIDQQVERTLLWKRYPRGSGDGYGSFHVVHGHAADERAPIVTRGRSNLDAKAWKTGRLVVAVFEDDKPGAAIGYLDVRGSAID